MNRPACLYASGKLEWSIILQDQSAAPVDADSNPTVTIFRKTSGGAYAATGEVATITHPEIGEYNCTLDPAGEVEGDTIRIVETVTIDGITYQHVWYCAVRVPERGTNGASTHAAPDLANLDVPVSSRSSHGAPDLANLDVPVSSRQATGTVTVGGYDAGQSPADLVWDEPRSEHTTDGTFGASAASGGAADPEQLNRIEAQTSKIIGAKIEVASNVRPGGHIELHHGDDHTVALGNAVYLPVDDPGGALHGLMTAVGTENLSVAAIRGSDTSAARTIAGTVAAVSHVDDVLTVTIEFTSTETVKGVVGPLYVYDIFKTDTPTRTYVSGKLTLTRDAG